MIVLLEPVHPRYTAVLTNLLLQVNNVKYRKNNLKKIKSKRKNENSANNDKKGLSE